VTITNGAHGGEKSRGAKPLTEDPRSILATVIGVQYRLFIAGLFIGLAADNGHAQGVGDQFGAHVPGDRPADDKPGIGVHHRGAVQGTFPGGVLRDIGDPQPIRLVTVKLRLTRSALGAASGSRTVQPRRRRR